MSNQDVIDLESDDFEVREEYKVEPSSSSSSSNRYEEWAKREPDTPNRPRLKGKKLSSLKLEDVQNPVSLAIVQAAPPDKRKEVEQGARIALALQTKAIAANMKRAEKKGKQYTPKIPLHLLPVDEQMAYFVSLNDQYQAEQSRAAKDEELEKKAKAFLDPKVKKELKKEKQDEWLESRKEERRQRAVEGATKRVAFERLLPDTSRRENEEQAYRNWQVKKEPGSSFQSNREFEEQSYQPVKTEQSSSDTYIPPLEVPSNRHDPIDLDD